MKRDPMRQPYKLVRGWGLMEGWHLRLYPRTDCLGAMDVQPAIWATRREARDMAMKGEKPVRISVWYEVRNVPE